MATATTRTALPTVTFAFGLLSFALLLAEVWWIALGTLTFPFGVVFGILAIITGHISRRRIRRSGNSAGSLGANLGLIFGYFGAAVSLLIFLTPIGVLRFGRERSYPSMGAGSIRSINTVQISYRSKFPGLGFARDLATLGPGAAGENCEPSQEHACMIDSELGAPQCSPTVWCTKGGYRFNLHAFCPRDECTDYVATASPVYGAHNDRNFCSTADGVIHQRRGPPLAEPLHSVAECHAWELL